LDGLAGFYALPLLTAPSAQEGHDVGADMILAQELERLVRRGQAVMGESVKALLFGRHCLRHRGAKQARCELAATIADYWPIPSRFIFRWSGGCF
jgi:hypothetical protein